MSPFRSFVPLSLLATFLFGTGSNTATTTAFTLGTPPPGTEPTRFLPSSELYASVTANTKSDSERTRSSDRAEPRTETVAAAPTAPPSTVANRVFSSSDRRPVILFDGVCNLCNSAVNLALDWDPSGKLRFAALQSQVGRALLQVHGRKSDDISSIVLVTPDGAHTKSDAILRITQELTPSSWLLPLRPAAVLARIVVPQLLRDIIYDGVANNRYQIMGRRDQCRLDADGEFDNRFVDDSLALE